jgi:hypothetical protein
MGLILKLKENQHHVGDMRVNAIAILMGVAMSLSIIMFPFPVTYAAGCIILIIIIACVDTMIKYETWRFYLSFLSQLLTPMPQNRLT